jgi:hypothetical protein
MRKNYNEWMLEAAKELTPTGKFKRPSYETVANWVKDSWNAVDTNLIQKSFKCCGISNKRDGTEDDLIFDYGRLGQRDKPSDGVEVLSDKDESDEEDEDYRNDEDEDSESDEEDEDSERGEEDEDSERDEEDEESEEEDEYDEGYCVYYEQGGTNYANVWDE